MRQKQLNDQNINTFRRRATWLSLAAAATAALPAGASAATATWTGGSGTTSNWSDPANWGGVAPVSGADSVLFDGLVQTTNNNDFVNATLRGINFAPTAGAFTLTGNAVTLGFYPTGPITSSGDVVNGATADQTLNLGLNLDVGRHNFTTGANALNLHGPITRVKGSTAVFNTTGGAINVAGSGLANDASGILGGWATTGAHLAALDGSNNVVAYSAYTDIAGGGSIVDGPNTNVRIPANTTAVSFAPVAPDTTVRINTLTFGDGLTASTAAQVVNVGAANTVVLGQNGGIFNTTAITSGGAGTVRALTFGSSVATGGTLTAGDGTAPANITISSTALNDTNRTGTVATINSAIKDNNGQAVSVTIAGGYVALAGANTHSGGTYILSGRVSQSTPASFGSGPIYVYAGGQTNTNATFTTDHNFFIAGHGTPEQTGLGAIRMFGTGSIAGTVTLMDTASISPTNNSTPSVTGKITGPGGLVVGRGNGSQGGGVLTIGKTSGTANVNDYAGDTTIYGPTGGTANNPSSTLRIAAHATPGGNDNIMPHGTGMGNLVLDGKVPTPATSNHAATFDLNGSTQTVNGLTNTATAPLNNFVQSAAAGGHLIVGDGDATATYAGVIQNGAGTLALTKIGAGTQTLAGTHTHTGATTVNGGTLALAASWDTTSPVVLNTGGTLRVNAGGDKTLRVTSLAIAGGRLDMTDNDLLVNYGDLDPSPEGTVRQWVKDGRVVNSTSGIFATPGSPDDDVALAVADNAAWGKTVFNGINIDSSTVVGKYTYFGDANLDGKVTGDDYLNVDANLGTGDSWLEGDFNMSGVTTGDDYLAIDANLGKGTANPLAFAELKEEMVALHAAMFGEEYLVKLAQAEAEGFGASVVPEPAALSLIGLGAIGMLGRRRRGM